MTIGYRERLVPLSPVNFPLLGRDAHLNYTEQFYTSYDVIRN